LEKTVKAIMNGQSRDTSNCGHMLATHTLRCSLNNRDVIISNYRSDY
jgi:hypothetical protein